MPKRSPASSTSRPLTKSLFEAGLQCAKRLYLEYHGLGKVSGPPPTRAALSEVGRQLVELARKAFPKGVQIPVDDDEAALAATAKALETDAPQVLFDAAFSHAGAMVRCDILLRDKTGAVDVFEVKSGLKVRPRYVTDLALQCLVLEGAGVPVRRLYVVHLDPQYRYEGGDHPVQRLFQTTEVTDRVRQNLDRTAETLEVFKGLVEDEETLELPTGTWCTHPFVCPHLPRCAAEEPELPLRLLPELTREQEQLFHQECIVSLDGIEPDRSGLTHRQRRTLQALQEGRVLLEPFVREELLDLDSPLQFLAMGSVLDVLPRYPGTRPWRPLPFAWSMQALDEAGQLRATEHVQRDPEDPRPALISRLADSIGGGTLIVWHERDVEQLRPLMEDLPQTKKAVRKVLNAPRIALEPLLAAGLFHPELLERPDLGSVLAVLTPDHDPRPEIGDTEAATAAFRRLQARRTRAATRERLSERLREYYAWRSKGLLALYRHLTSEPAD